MNAGWLERVGGKENPGEEASSPGPVRAVDPAGTAEPWMLTAGRVERGAVVLLSLRRCVLAGAT